MSSRKWCVPTNAEGLMSTAWQNIDGIETAVAETASDFVAALRPSHPHWWENGACPWVFRGHGFEHWPLLPTAWRPNNAIMTSCRAEAERRYDAVKPKQHLNWFWHPNFWSGSASFGPNDAELMRDLTVHTTAEYLPIWDFAAMSDELGMQTPLMGTGPDPVREPDWLADAHAPLHSDELLRFSDFPAALALAQHHGIPTRLLDWTRNPIAAAYFAVEPLRDHSADKNLVVWALHKRNSSLVTVEGVDFPNAPLNSPRFDSGIVIVRPPTRDNPFLAAQAGLFTSISCSGIYFMRSGGRRPSLEALVSQARPESVVLRKLVLSHAQAPDLVEILRRERVSRSTLMPTMDNVARDVRNKWTQNAALSNAEMP